jgi:hypothetical protein
MVLLVLPGHVIAFLHDLTSRPRYATDENCGYLENGSSEHIYANSIINLGLTFCDLN